MFDIHVWLVQYLGYDRAVILKNFIEDFTFFCVGFVITLFIVARMLVKVTFESNMNDILSVLRLQLGKKKQARVNLKQAKTFTGMFYIIVGLFYTALHPNKKHIISSQKKALFVSRLFLVLVIVIVTFGGWLMLNPLRPPSEGY